MEKVVGWTLLVGHFLIFGCSNVHQEIGEAYLAGDRDKVLAWLDAQKDTGLLINKEIYGTYTLLGLAVKECDAEFVGYALEYGADVNVLVKGRSVIGMAPECDDINILHLFLESGQAIHEVPVVQSAIINDRLKWLEAMGSFGVDFGRKNHVGMNAVHFAVLFQRYEILEFLLKSGAAVNEGDIEGLTPLHVACRQAFDGADSLLLDCVELLLMYGADPYVKSNEGESAYECAVDNGVSELIVLFDQSR